MFSFLCFEQKKSTGILFSFVPSAGMKLRNSQIMVSFGILQFGAAYV